MAAIQDGWQDSHRRSSVAKLEFRVFLRFLMFISTESTFMHDHSALKAKVCNKSVVGKIFFIYEENFCVTKVF